jgi:hypothetical protein
MKFRGSSFLYESRNIKCLQTFQFKMLKIPLSKNSIGGRCYILYFRDSTRKFIEKKIQMVDLQGRVCLYKDQINDSLQEIMNTSTHILMDGG